MRTSMLLAAATLASAATVTARPSPQEAPSLGALLEPGMRLNYSSGGASQPWTIELVRRDTTVGGRAGCVVIRLRTSPTQPAPETRAHCAVGGEMQSWIASENRLRTARPLAAGEVSIPRAAGGVVRFVASAPERDTVSGVALVVVPTVVTTTDSTGRTIRRLTERFAIELATATRGVFEVPDSSAAGGWRTERAFELTAIERPDR